ncbi:hypothetical protein [Sphingobacterium griseoflavum]|uniref:hypothetical protein n=1 Tax=Sphingobacterium griseoflavum TaxID=1474952 RepID=UPI0016790C4C|nr:hypothetical protein [Sphingobacterium griseoflavum]
MRRFSQSALVIFTMAMMNSCQVAEVVFHTGAWSGVIAVILISVAVIWIMARIMGRRRKDDWTKR